MYLSFDDRETKSYISISTKNIYHIKSSITNTYHINED